MQKTNNEPNINPRSGNPILAGVAVGILLGLAFGTAIDNYIAALAVGEGIGVLGLDGHVLIQLRLTAQGNPAALHLRFR